MDLRTLFFCSALCHKAVTLKTDLRCWLEVTSHCQTHGFSLAQQGRHKECRCLVAGSTKLGLNVGQREAAGIPSLFPEALVLPSKQRY